MIDTPLIEQLGADDYGMKQFTLVLLKAGPNQSLDADQSATLQAEHLKHLKQLMDKGDILILGPLMADIDLRGICIYKTSSLEEARALAENDPAVKAGSISIEMYPWYGSAAIAKIPEIHKTIETKSFVQIQ